MEIEINIMKTLQSAAFVFCTLLLTGSAAQAQNSKEPQVSVINLQTVRNQNGTQSVITPKGDLAVLPGAGVDGAVAQIYFGSQGGFWYQDRTGQTIDLSPTVQDLQARRARQVPQYAPITETPAQTVQESSNGNRPVGSAVTTAVAAAGGAALGTAMTHGYYNAPYGTPMYYGHSNSPYYYRDGERREVEELNQNQKMVLYNKRQVENQQKQQALQQRQSNQQSQQQQTSQRQGGGQQANFERQEQWYQQQVKEKPSQFQRQAENPFASQQSSGRFANGGDDGGRHRERSSQNAERGGRQSARERGGDRAGARSGVSRGGGGGRRGR